ncbi:MAG: type IV secretion system protein [Gammaproteobacteria bacterium]
MQPNNKKTVTPYLDARREWNERYGSHIIEARNWRMVTFVIGAALIISIFCNVLQVQHEKIAVYYVNTDKGGNTYSVWRADQSTPGPKTEQIRAALQNWLLGARTVYADSRATNRVIDATYAMTLPDSIAYKELSSYHREHNPYERAANETVELILQIPVQLTKDTWQLEWTEIVKNRTSGKMISTENYQLTANVLIASPKDEAQLIANPIGLFVRQFSWPVRNLSRET